MLAHLSDVRARLSCADALRSRIDASRHDMVALGLPRPLTNEPDGINAALVSTNTLPHNAILPVPDNPYKLWDGETSKCETRPGYCCSAFHERAFRGTEPRPGFFNSVVWPLLVPLAPGVQLELDIECGTQPWC